ncbi:MAG: ABC transporter substrate-binding protein [Deltaproteobacteria bacterium]|nr:ABC transporter substrate-binding protein [Deltaproteobacteria bacterium]
MRGLKAKSLCLLAVLFLAALPGCSKKEEKEAGQKAFQDFAGRIENRSQDFERPAPAEPSEERPLKVGLIGPETGEGAEIGRMTFEGAKMAAEEINGSGGVNGVPIELIPIDTREDSSATKEALNRLISENVAAIIGAPTGWATLTPVYISNESRTIFISAGTRRHIGSSGPFVFRVSLPLEKAAEELLEYSVKTEGLKTFFFVTVMEDEALNVGAAFRRGVEKKGGSVKGQGSIFTEDDIAGAVGDLKKHMPVDGVIFAGGPRMAVGFAKEAKKAGISLPLLGGEELHNEEFLKDGDLVAGSLVYSSFSTDDPDPATKNFISSYAKRYGHKPDVFSAEAYDTYMILAAALRKSGSTNPEALKEAIVNIKGFKGVSGTIDMGPDKEARRSAYLLKAVKSGASTVFSIVKNPHEK